MTVAIGFGELFDRVEKTIGKRPTKILVYGAWLAAMAFFINSTFDYLVKPMLKIGPDVYTALGLTDILRVIFTVLIGFAMGSWILDAYRMKLLRTEYETATGTAHGLLDDMRTFRSSSRQETREVIDEATDLIKTAGKTILQARALHEASLMVAEELYAVASSKEVLSDQTIESLRSLIDDLRGMATDTDDLSQALTKVEADQGKMLIP